MDRGGNKESETAYVKYNEIYTLGP